MRVFCLNSRKRTDKLDPREVWCVFLGYFFVNKRDTMLESRQQQVCDLCGCQFLWKHTLLFSL